MYEKSVRETSMGNRTIILSSIIPRYTQNELEKRKENIQEMLFNIFIQYEPKRIGNNVETGAAL